MKYWTRSWNVVTGCTPVSAGCSRCWARAFAAARPQVTAGHGFDPTFHGDRLDLPLGWHPERWRDVPYRLHGRPLVAVAWMGDLFHEAISFRELDLVFDVLADVDETAAHLLLTKRIQRARAYLQARQGNVGMMAILGQARAAALIGTSIENQAAAADRLPELEEIAANRWPTWLSVEPLLERVDLRLERQPAERRPRLVVVGPQTGPGAAPCEQAWLDDVERQCREVGVECLMKRRAQAQERTAA